MSKRINIEVEIGKSFSFHIVQELNGFWIGYDSESFQGWDPSRSDLEWIVEVIKKVMKELDIQTPHFALDLILSEGLGAQKTTCCVNKQKDIIYLRLPIEVVDRQLGISVGLEIHEDYVFYHELMHAKDVLERRFPSSGFTIPKESLDVVLTAALIHFSIEGRLEKEGKPHKRKQDAIDDELFWMTVIEKIPLTKQFFQKACDKFWGKEVTFQELQSYAQKALKTIKV